MKKKKPDQKMQAWIDARNRHRLSHAEVQMARELGMNPKKLSGLDNHRHEPWKVPLGQFIQQLYFKQFAKERPDLVLSIEEKIRRDEQKKARRREAKLLRRQAASPRAGEEQASSSDRSLLSLPPDDLERG